MLQALEPLPDYKHLAIYKSLGVVFELGSKAPDQVVSLFMYTKGLKLPYRMQVLL